MGVGLVYWARGLAAWADRTWQFVGAVLLLSLDRPGSLQVLHHHTMTC